MSTSSNERNTHENHGPVFTCGCSGVYMDHKPGEPTVFDTMADRIVNLFTHKRRSTV